MASLYLLIRELHPGASDRASITAYTGPASIILMLACPLVFRSLISSPSKKRYWFSECPVTGARLLSSIRALKELISPVSGSIITCRIPLSSTHRPLTLTAGCPAGASAGSSDRIYFDEEKAGASSGRNNSSPVESLCTGKACPSVFIMPCIPSANSLSSITGSFLPQAVVLISSISLPREALSRFLPSSSRLIRSASPA